MRFVQAVLVLVIVITGISSSAAQPAEQPSGSQTLTPFDRKAHEAKAQQQPMKRFQLEPTTGQIAKRTLFEQLTRNLSWVPAVLLFLAALLKGDRGAWWFAFLAGVATLVVFGAQAFLSRFGAWLSEPVGMMVGTAIVLIGTFGLFILHQRRLDIFARTEVVFGVVGIGYSIHMINDNTGAWAMLIVSVYGLVEGFTRMREADGPDSLLAVFDAPKRSA